jgi:hypothetical protein
MRRAVLLAALVVALGHSACRSVPLPRPLSSKPKERTRTPSCATPATATTDACMELALRLLQSAMTVPQAMEIFSIACEQRDWSSCGLLALEDRAREDQLARATRVAEDACRQKGTPDACEVLIELTRRRRRALYDAATEVSDRVKECARSAHRAMAEPKDVEPKVRDIGECAHMLDTSAPPITRQRDQVAQSSMRTEGENGEESVEDVFRDTCRALQEGLSVHDVDFQDFRDRRNALGRTVTSPTCEALGLPLKTWDYPQPEDLDPWTPWADELSAP